jgi:hypothetical protein
MGLLFFSRFKVKVSKTTKKKYNLHLFLCHLAKGKSMANYKDYKLLFNFLKLKKKIPRIIGMTESGWRLLSKFTTRFW